MCVDPSNCGGACSECAGRLRCALEPIPGTRRGCPSCGRYFKPLKKYATIDQRSSVLYIPAHKIAERTKKVRCPGSGEVVGMAPRVELKRRPRTMTSRPVMDSKCGHVECPPSGPCAAPTWPRCSFCGQPEWHPDHHGQIHNADMRNHLFQKADA